MIQTGPARWGQPLSSRRSVVVAVWVCLLAGVAHLVALLLAPESGRAILPDLVNGVVLLAASGAVGTGGRRRPYALAFATGYAGTGAVLAIPRLAAVTVGSGEVGPSGGASGITVTVVTFGLMIAAAVVCWDRLTEAFEQGRRPIENEPPTRHVGVGGAVAAGVGVTVAAIWPAAGTRIVPTQWLAGSVTLALLVAVATRGVVRPPFRAAWLVGVASGCLVDLLAHSGETLPGSWRLAVLALATAGIGALATAAVWAYRRGSRLQQQTWLAGQLSAGLESYGTTALRARPRVVAGATASAIVAFAAGLIGLRSDPGPGLADASLADRVAYVPAAVAPSCVEADVQPYSGIDSDVSTLACSTGSAPPAQAYFSFFAVPEQAKSTFDRWTSEFGPPDIGLCRTGESGVFEWSRQVGARAVHGRAACYLSGSGVPKLVWTDDDRAVLGIVVGSAGSSMSDLASTWRDALLPPGGPATPETPSPSDDQAPSGEIRIDAPEEIVQMSVSIATSPAPTPNFSAVLVGPDGAEVPLRDPQVVAGRAFFDVVDAASWHPAPGPWQVRLLGPPGTTLQWWQIDLDLRSA